MQDANTGEAKPKIRFLYTVNEAAKYLRVDGSTFRRWIKKGKVPGIVALPSENDRSQHSNYRVPRSSLAQLLNVDEEQIELPVLSS